jgi:tRNA(Ile)-lysidine synthetase-like protein
MEDGLLEKVRFPVPGRYVIAVSGGVDSVSLLYLLHQRGKYELIVAHCHHGIRSDADADEELVREIAEQYGLQFRSTHLRLGADASEDEARRQRYAFLYSVQKEEQANGVVTAHHVDDRLETMLLNQQRGAGWLGLSPLWETETIKRPLLEVTKQELEQYARRYSLDWREDVTNLDSAYTPRNRIRRQLAEAGQERRQELYAQLRQYDKERRYREQRSWDIIASACHISDSHIWVDRIHLLLYEARLARDVLYLLLKTYFQEYMEIDYDAVLRLEHFYKTASSGKQLPLSERVWARMHNDAMLISVT